ncbi:hypothetical protein ABHI18_002520, partial [Aspergillus niger]
MLRDELLRSKKDEIARCLSSRKRKLSELYFATVGFAGATENAPADSLYHHKEQAFLDANDLSKGRYFNPATLPPLPDYASILARKAREAEETAAATRPASAELTAKPHDATAPVPQLGAQSAAAGAIANDVERQPKYQKVTEQKPSDHQPEHRVTTNQVAPAIVSQVSQVPDVSPAAIAHPAQPSATDNRASPLKTEARPNVYSNGIGEGSASPAQAQPKPNVDARPPGTPELSS